MFKVNQIGIRCLIAQIRNQNAKPHRQQDTELNVGELLEQPKPDEQRVSEYDGQVREHCGQDWQHLHQQPSDPSASEHSVEEAQKNW